MHLYSEILRLSAAVDARFADASNRQLASTVISFQIPHFHPRHARVERYSLAVASLDTLANHPVVRRSRKHVWLIGRSTSTASFVVAARDRIGGDHLVLQSVESSVKTKPYLDELVASRELHSLSTDDTLLVVGGGLLLNAGAYAAEQLGTSLILVPTTVLAMSDGAGGKVRVNQIAFGRAYKHYYKSFYEPNALVLDTRFLALLPQTQVRVGLVEIIKHGLFQSPSLLDYLTECGASLLEERALLLKAILWAADLKRVCLEIDVEENENGSRRILRAGHDFSDRLEEDSGLNIPHGYAVAIGICKALRVAGDLGVLRKAERVFGLLGIPRTLEEYDLGHTSIHATVRTNLRGTK